ncbi:MAG: DsbA family protein [Acidobacteriaceae bacterium]
MRISRPLVLVLFVTLLASFHGYAQSSAGTSTANHGSAEPSSPNQVSIGVPLSPAMTHRIQVLLRNKAELPPGSTIAISTPQPATLSGYDTIAVTFTAEGKTSRPVNFLISRDGNTLAQFIRYDLSVDPRTMVPSAGRPFRGGPASAPVVLVNFDDLECPFCARFHNSLFPAITQRYGDKVHIVYLDFPLDQHPWAMHAAVDANCLAQQSPAGYWNVVDYIHKHHDDIGTAAADPSGSDAKADGAAGAHQAQSALHTLNISFVQLDEITHDQGVLQKVDMPRLDACIRKQDTSTVEAERQIGNNLNVESTPTFYINGAKYEGALPTDYIFSQIDDALRAEGIQPPPPNPPVSPKSKAPAASAAAQ